LALLLQLWPRRPFNIEVPPVTEPTVDKSTVPPIAVGPFGTPPLDTLANFAAIPLVVPHGGAK
jgi:hypothetical protein